MRYKNLLYITAITLATIQISQAQVNDPQGQKIETVNGKNFIIHKIKPQETYYQLSRQYGLPVKDIMSANKNKNLRVGDTVRIPTLQPVEPVIATTVLNTNTTAIPPANSSTTNNSLADDANILTEYKVGNNETLYSIARRFATSVDAIKTLNNLKNDVVREGQTLKIPDGELPEVEPIVAEPISTAPAKVEANIVAVERTNVSAQDFEKNKYGIRERSERGVGVWMENLETSNKSNLALHRSAPVGTILKITNPITKNVTYAKVVGKFADNAETQDAIVILSKSAAAYIGALDKRFLIEINYGLPLEYEEQ